MSWNAVTLSTNNFKLGGNVICSEIHDLNFRMEEKRHWAIWACQSLSHFYEGISKLGSRVNSIGLKNWPNKIRVDRTREIAKKQYVNRTYTNKIFSHENNIWRWHTFCSANNLFLSKNSLMGEFRVRFDLLCQTGKLIIRKKCLR